MLGIFSQNLAEALSPLAQWARRSYAQHTGPGELNYWIWLIGALLAVDLLYRIRARPGQNPRKIYSHPSALLDYKLVVVERVVTASIIGPMLVSALALGEWGSKILTASLGTGPGWKPGLPALIVFAAARLLLFDIGHYISHYIQHKVPFFWEFHRVHHSAEVLTPVTAYRVHPVETLLDSMTQGPLQALGFSLFYYLYGTDQSFLTFVGANAIVVPYFLIGSLRHSHVWISYGPTLEHIFSSPAQHQIHHSRAPQHWDRNLSEYFSFLDWIGGTLYVPQGKESLEFGLSEGDQSELTSVRSAYWVPVKRAFALLLRPYIQAPVRTSRAAMD